MLAGSLLVIGMQLKIVICTYETFIENYRYWHRNLCIKLWYKAHNMILKGDIHMSSTSNEKLKSAQQEEYHHLVNRIKPKPPIVQNCLWAFVVGGLICVVGQLIMNYLLSVGINKLDAGSLTAIIMIFLGALLTGLGIYDDLGQKAGAGSIVPITGFANAIVASAMEFKREGYIFGVGSRIFSIAGPTLVFGFVASVLIGLIKLVTI